WIQATMDEEEISIVDCKSRESSSPLLSKTQCHSQNIISTGILAVGFFSPLYCRPQYKSNFNSK
ncbi:hypothetical protein S245_020223, partial [Arachis hypogaea]